MKSTPSLGIRSFFRPQSKQASSHDENAAASGSAQATANLPHGQDQQLNNAVEASINDHVHALCSHPTAAREPLRSLPIGPPGSVQHQPQPPIFNTACTLKAIGHAVRAGVASPDSTVKPSILAGALPAKAPHSAVQEPTRATGARELTAPAAASATNTVPGGGGRNNDYERIRQERIAANQARMRELGLANGIAAELGPALNSAAKPAGRPRGSKRPPAAPQEPVRRSGRRRGENPHAARLPGEPQPAQDRFPEVPTFAATEPAPWLADMLRHQNATSAAALWDRPVPAHAAFTGYTGLHCALEDPRLRGVYGMHWWGGMLGVAGKDGLISLFKVPRGDEARASLQQPVEPLLSCKLHRGWISDIQFLSSNIATAGDAYWVASASNDGSLAVWSCSEIQADGLLASVASTNDVHQGGIFSMHARRDAADINFLTASKDASVKLSRLAQNGQFRTVRSWDSIHGTVAKSVRWRNEHCAASAGNDKSIALLDTRSLDVTRIAAAHAGVVNQICWAAYSDQLGQSAPASETDQASAGPLATTFGPAEHLLLSSGSDLYVRVFDVRHTAQPWAELFGHSSAPGNRSCSIVQADFAWGGRAVVTGGEGSHRVSVYDLRKSGAEAASSDGKLMLSQTEARHRVATLRCSGSLVACAGASASMSVLRVSV